MVRKILVSAVLAGSLLVVSGCHHKVQNPLANVDSKQPDKVLFDRAMESMKKGRYSEARTLLETLINTYPDSEYIARAKLSLGDAWYAEGGKAAWQQAEVEYKDFQTFFPNLPEASEAQLKIATMHYREMEKPDRDYAEAQRAAEEYRVLIQQYPDSPLVPQAKQKLREVQEIQAERQFRIAHFYYLRDNLAASQARQRQRIPDAQKEKLVAQFEKKAIDAYSKIITRYPATARVGDAKSRLAALKAPIPEPTAEALAESKAEEESRHKLGLVDKVTGNFQKRPNVLPASGVGEPNMQDETVTSAAAIVSDLKSQMNGAQPGQNIGVQAVSSGAGTPGENEKAPTSQSASPATDGTAPTPAPAQVNEIQKSDTAAAPATTDGQAATAPADPKQESSSKKKNKKGLRKLIPF
jgi:outer membrane protein assembly factor BamD